MRYFNQTNQLGFGVVEMLVTIVVVGLFAITFYQLFTTVRTINSAAGYHALANDISYSYLRKYAAVVAPTIPCDATTDITQNSLATGTVLEGGALTSESTGLPTPVSYQVTALAIYGCNGANSGSPLKIESYVEYGSRNMRVKHGTLIGY